jgi:hypothetical protein
MKKMDFSRHTIADLRDWNEVNRLEIQPDFQRKFVWPAPAQIMLIDSILSDIPLPKIFIASKIKHGKTHRIVIDGQQRITSILSFLSDKFSLSAPYEGKFSNKNFTELPEATQNKILSYRLDFNEFENYTDAEMRDIYNRVNKYTSALTQQELRKADFPGDFLRLSETLASNERLDEAKVFTVANRRRMADVEYTSELLAILIDGPQDKKLSLNDFYLNYAKWDEVEKNSCQTRFELILDDIFNIFPLDSFPLKSTRFRQKSDFYSLFSAINTLKNKELKLDPSLIDNLILDFKIINFNVLPGEHNIFGQYASKCLSDANSRSSREWREAFIGHFLTSAYSPLSITVEKLEFFINILIDFEYVDPMCPPGEHSCSICEIEDTFNSESWTFAFPKDEVFLSSALHVHRECLKAQPDNLVYISDE